MINSINVRKYRNLDELKIRSLVQVNLITGKNNTGKSTLLEAIAIYTAKSNLGIISQILEERGESYRQTPGNKNITESNTKTLSSLFTNRVVSFNHTDSITIGPIENTLFGEQNSTEDLVSLRFVKYIDEVIDQSDSIIRRQRKIIEDDRNNLIDFKVGFEMRVGTNSFLVPLEEERFFRIGFRGSLSTEKFQFIRTRNIDREINGKLWDNITLTEKEQFVIGALKIIEPLVERIAFIEEGLRYRTAVVKLSNNNAVFPLQSMGDGINRILTIILALVNSDNGILLIDEFENGLHHSVQEKLWEIIFNLSFKLNVQVFATTHSEDCISGFQNILNSPSNSIEGKLIRLDNVDGKIKQVEFTKNELQIASNKRIEIR
ncbi:MAG: hypothetical protein A2W90_08865 [Bacteroidetes bacterium GWF2_42_66]|nr:MAG: hypothetical protein A2W92_17605 [Bacteroidetes bacterium GWA2_42_15]OFX96777.1 MAG: hypothetical protein A2W89_21450 [Bacteroidetes bacterium GWE2_42_39]OFY45469.1 MAG: hypothetical protein A2W90_08865 [Bacteroidetes bacterium GWF2_42_66]HBL76144.1 hypothetical protein [Prolixibacteraceae bacterium]HCR91554.1 hypothetical protein [Prolixibacteraceae bacterium]